MSQISLANNDYNWRLVAASALAENVCVTVDGAGKAALFTGTSPLGIVVQPYNAGERAAIIRGGKLGGLTGFSAGALLRPQAANGTLGTAGALAVVAIVTSEDTSTAVIVTGALVHA